MLKRHELQLQKVPDEMLSILGQHAFRVKLNAFDRMTAMAQTHDGPILCTRCDLQFRWEPFFRNDERMVASAGHGIAQVLEDGLTIMRDLAGLAMHYLWRADHFSAKGCTDGLMAQAHPKYGNFAGKVANQINGDAGVLRRAGARRNQDTIGLECLYLCGRQFIVATDRHLCPQLAHILHQVVGKRIVSIEDENHRGPVFSVSDEQPTRIESLIHLMPRGNDRSSL